METTVQNSESIGEVVSVLFSAAEGFEIFGLNFVYWFAIILVLTAVGFVIKGVKR